MAELRLLAFLCCLSVLCGQTAVVGLCGSDPVGTAVSVSAICYPNGSAVVTWSTGSPSSVRRLQIEYQCYTDADAQPDPEVVLPWSTRKDGSRTVDDILNENTTCIFSGCYEKSNFFGRRIQAVNCTLPVVPTTTSLPTSVEPTTTFLITTQPTVVHPTSPPPMIITSTLGSPTASATPTAAESNGMQSTDGMPGSSLLRLGTGAVIAIAVGASVVALGIIVCVCLIILSVIYRKKLERKYKFNNDPYKEEVDPYFYPVCITPRSAKSIESIITVLERLFVRVPAITDVKLASEKTKALLEEDGDFRSICTQPAEDTDCSILMQPAEDTDCSILLQPAEDTDCSILMQPEENTDAGVPAITPGVTSKKDGDRPEEDKEDDCSMQVQPTEGTGREPSTPVIAIPEHEVVKPHGTGRDINTPLVNNNRGYIPVEQVLNSTTSSASN